MKRILLAAALFAIPSSAFAQPVPGASCPPNAESAIECLLANLNAVLPAGCAPVDFKALAKRIRDTDKISVFVKLRLAARMDSLSVEAKEFVRAETPEKKDALRRSYEKLFSEFIDALGGRDATLAAEATCARSVGLEVLILGARRDG